MQTTVRNVALSIAILAILIAIALFIAWIKLSLELPTLPPASQSTTTPTETILGEGVTVISSPTEIIGITSASEYVPGSEVTYQTKFDDMIGWGGFGTTDFANGRLALNGTSAGAGHDAALSKGYGILVLFRFTPGTSANVVLFNSITNGDREIGISVADNFAVCLNYNGSWHGGQSLNGNLRYTADHWYYALIEVKNGGQFYLKVWDKDNLSQYVEKTLPMGSEWEKSLWYGSITVNTGNRGTIEVATYQEFRINNNQ